MKRGVLILLLLFVLLISACESSNQSIKYPTIITNQFVRDLVAQNTILQQNISDLNKKITEQERDIDFLLDKLSSFYQLPASMNSPFDRIKGENIIIMDDKIIIELENASISNIADTHSLEPLIDKGTNVIEITPKSTEDIHLGDIVAYQSEFAEDIILHRVISLGIDDEGWYAMMKGDNNPTPDPGRVRFEQIQRVVVGIIY